MLEVIRSYISDGIGVLHLVAVLLVVFAVLTTWTRTKSAMATVGAMVVGALVLGYVYNAEWFGQKAAEDIRERDNGMPPVELVHEAAT